MGEIAKKSSLSSGSLPPSPIMADEQQLLAESAALENAIKASRQAAHDTSLPEAAQDIEPVEVTLLSFSWSNNDQFRYRCRRTMKSHAGKIYSMAWCSDSERVLSAAQDGKLIIWDARDGEKLGAAFLRSNWVMTSAFAPSGNFVASGGLDNICTIWNVEKFEEPVKELSGHSGFLSSCKFVDDKQILTSSGDTTAALWDIERGQKVSEFLGHQGDVTSVSLLPGNNTFVSCSVDSTVKVWDMRTRLCVTTLRGHVGDVNCLAVFPNGNTVVTGGEDKTCRLFDLRADQEIAQYFDESFNEETGDGKATGKTPEGISCVAFSASGRLIYSGRGELIHVWDTLRGEFLGSIGGHDQRVSSIGVSPNGMALCSASWDYSLRVWN